MHRAPYSLALATIKSQRVDRVTFILAPLPQPLPFRPQVG